MRYRRDLAVGPRELSVLLCTITMRAAGLEWYEQADVWHRVITDEHRSALGDVPEDRLNARAQEVLPLLRADTDILLRVGGSLESVAKWAAAFRSAGEELGCAVGAGTLDRGLRQVFGYHVIFHWNRLGLSMRGQSVLAWAARAAILHRSTDDKSPVTPGAVIPFIERKKPLKVGHDLRDDGPTSTRGGEVTHAADPEHHRHGDR
ncbi:thiopeptide-type bacteriocin biosynthesis protein [Streptomyces sp. P9-A2]|uniref:thiopeptide-type bacteriocin biosynthesis protein n=1 Tax=Streptomyces sp. P9-A2 TaxID=3072284 RepID=UPI002FCB2C0E